MPSLAEGAPEYAEKVKEYCAKHGLQELPWGHIVVHGHMVATSTVRERREHAAHETGLSPESRKLLDEGLRQVALSGVSVVPDLDELDHPSVGEPVPGSQVDQTAPAVGVQATDAGGVVAPLVVPT